MLETEKILKSNFFILAVILLFPLEFHGTDFEKLFLLRATVSIGEHNVQLFNVAGTAALLSCDCQSESSFA